MIVESDIFAIHGSYIDISYFGTLVDNCKILSKDLDECSFVYIKISANQMVHSLARTVDFMFDRGVWFSAPPLFLCHVLALDYYE